MRKRLDGECGATAIEYALIAMAIAAIIVLVAVTIGEQTRTGFCEGSSAMEVVGAQNNPDCP